jgi:hypothetical protein
MRRWRWSLPLLAVTLLVMLGAQGSQDPAKTDGAAGKIIGTWKLVSAKYDGEESDLPKNSTTLKHITPGNFVWVTYEPDTNQVTRAAGGTYTLDGEKYEESPQYGLGGDFKVVEGKRHTFTIKIDGGTLHQNGELSSGLKIEEVWELVRAK